MAALTQGDLQVQAAVPVMEIRQFHMEIQANAHPSFYLEGMLSEEDGKEGIRQPLAGTTVRIGAGSRLLFVGILEEAKVMQEGRGYRPSEERKNQSPDVPENQDAYKCIHYEYDKRGNLTGEYESGTLLHGYVYNAMNRLERA